MFETMKAPVIKKNFQSHAHNDPTITSAVYAANMPTRTVEATIDTAVQRGNFLDSIMAVTQNLRALESRRKYAEVRKFQRRSYQKLRLPFLTPAERPCARSVP